ncbi:hypothetical protein CCHR01_06057 [Colletotrichum chrysophilum]|uniref:Uncharacterized protein n=1 Tax=Colletotrichum chrysophilum TaxID=1836956 RepID=A0AAD9EKY4_9PEZI|nr:hypothetical protein CCHR01_06057 [Colletotrichum chrysophilum]
MEEKITVVQSAIEHCSCCSSMITAYRRDEGTSLNLPALLFPFLFLFLFLAGALCWTTNSVLNMLLTRLASTANGSGTGSLQEQWEALSVSQSSVQRPASPPL